MASSIFDANPLRLLGLPSTIQKMVDNPENHDRSRTTAEPSTSSLHPQPKSDEMGELFHRPLDYKELCRFRTDLQVYSPDARYQTESTQERHRFFKARAQRDQTSHSLAGRAGKQREKVMIRHNIKKRWEAMGVWNPSWGIPGRVNPGPNDDVTTWRWDWLVRPRKAGNFHEQPMDVQETSWPPQEEELVHERAIREHLEKNGQWTGPPSAMGQAVDVDVDAIDRESSITGRPWFVWQLDVEEEAIRLARLDRTEILDYEKAAKNVEARWRAEGKWKEVWVDYDDTDRPGWKWRHESPSPSPVQPKDMEFSPSEIDALESIPPPTPTALASPLPTPPVELEPRGVPGIPISDADAEQEDIGSVLAASATQNDDTVSGTPRRRGRPRTGQSTRQAKTTSPTLTQPARISKPATGTRHSTRVVQKERMKQLDAVVSMTAPDSTRRMTGEITREPRVPRKAHQEQDTSDRSGLTAKARGRPKKVVESASPPSPAKPRGRLKKMVDASSVDTTARPRGRPKNVVNPSSSSPTARPRGRPRKVAELSSAASPAKPRGRPKKMVDASSSASTARPRGRPRKVAELSSAASPIKPRGRPKKVVESSSSGSTAKPRGRPKKVDLSSSASTARPRGRPKKIVESSSAASTARPRGRPRKVDSQQASKPSGVSKQKIERRRRPRTD
jgi:hypothetical protein